jgi:4-alpha-glucanotransferase
LGENWKWRMDPKALTKQLAEKMHDLAQLYGRV